MTDTTETTVKRSQSPRNVDYELEVFDELPERATRQSPLEEALEKVAANEGARGKWVLIGRYAVLSAGTAAKHVLEIRHGDTAAVEGWLFQTRRVDKVDEAGTKIPMQGVFVNYDPSRVVDGAKALHDEKMAKRKAELKAKREANKNAADGKSDSKPTDADSKPTDTPAPSGNVPPPPPAPGSPGSKTGSDDDKKARAGGNRG